MSSYGSPSNQTMYRAAAGRPRSFNANVQSIAAAVRQRGVVLMRADQVVGTVEDGAAELCRTIRRAHELARGDDHKRRHVEQLTTSIAAKLGVRGAVQVTWLAWNLLQGYATPPARRCRPAVKPTSRGSRSDG